jgi:nucleotide-binding universal stress UspA family protein
MTTSTADSPRFVLVAAIDESPLVSLVIAQAASIARKAPSAEIHLVHIPDQLTHAFATAAMPNLEHAKQYLDARAKETQVASGRPVIGHVVESEAASAIVQLAASLDADLVIVGTNDKHGPARWILGSVALKVAQRAACPVLMVRAKDHVHEHAPEIDPPCPDCLREQAASRGANLWCARHSEHHPRAHLHYEFAEGFGEGSSLVQS